jgi:hypothetical protein
MSHIDDCLNTLRLLIEAGDPSGMSAAKEVIERYWAATPLRARKSGLLYIQQILHDRRDKLGPESRDFANTLDAYFETKLAGPLE